jgi:hypothetical protein
VDVDDALGSYICWPVCLRPAQILILDLILTHTNMNTRGCDVAAAVAAQAMMMMVYELLDLPPLLY